MSELTRRGFVKTSTTAAAGITVLGALRVAQADARESNPGSEPVVAFVSDPKRGEVLLMVGDREVSRRDPALVSALLRAAR